MAKVEKRFHCTVLETKNSRNKWIVDSNLQNRGNYRILDNWAKNGSKTHRSELETTKYKQI